MTVELILFFFELNNRVDLNNKIFAVCQHCFVVLVIKVPAIRKYNK